MTRDEFWRVIEDVRGSSGTDIEVREAELRARLDQLSAEDIASFGSHFTACLDQAYDWRLWGAAYLMQGGCSDDGFWDFRSSLISMGRATFERAVASPDSLADLPATEVENLCFEGFQYVAPQIYEQKTGEALQRASPWPESPSGGRWEEDDLPKLLPELTAKYGGDIWQSAAREGDEEASCAPPPDREPHVGHGTMGTEESTTTVYYAVEEIRYLDEAEVLCGLRRLDSPSEATAGLVLAASAEVHSAIEYQVGLHMLTEGYQPTTTRVVGVIVGQAAPSQLYRLTEDAAWALEREVSDPILFIEVAGPDASPDERSRHDDEILLYRPESAAACRRRPWWKFW